MYMNRMLLIIGAIAVLVIVGTGYYYISNQPQQPSGALIQEEATDIAIEEEQNATSEAMENGSYVPYSQTALENSPKMKRILYFYANWCPTCRPVNRELQENEAKFPEGVRVIRVNYNDTDTDEAEKELAKQYAITYQHTFVLIDENGKELKKWNGGGLDEIIAMTK